MDRKRKPTRTRQKLEEYNEEELVSGISSLIDDEYPAHAWKKILSRQLGFELPADRSELQTHLQSAAKEKLIEYTISLQTSLELRMSKQKRKRRRLRCVRHSEVQPSTPSEWYQARERRSTAQKLGSTEVALSRAKREHTERGGKIAKVRRHLMEAEQTVTSQTSELATLRRRLHERDQAAEQELHNYRQQLSVTNQNLVQAQRAAESTMEELLCTQATKEQMEKEFTEVYRQIRDQATTYSSTEEELAEARRTITEQKGQVSSLQKQLSESQAHARELLSTSRAELKQVKLAMDTATQQLQCNETRQADLEVAPSDGGQDKQQKREADGRKSQMAEVPAVSATEVASAQLGEELGECLDGRHIWNQPEQRQPRANAINDVQTIFDQDPGAPETGNDCFYNYRPVDQWSIQGPPNTEDNVIPVTAGLTYVARCCQQLPEATTNQGCILCAKHSKEFTWFTVSEMGTDWLPGLTCPACGDPECVSARALTDSFVEF
ncbi:hypothetical protein LTR47_011238 [Exophiala xenobiotica]|nr:hypothetical protein LTR47_011238 [Exophiala xenobiotica]KAK5222275.1 hypothetical protein LTR72_006532 [Exophiala xenobiotica]KAK5243807.1 hypothetical protein LTS06_010503 [Exophiala xenobiotica]KAK5283122.1 hypothetical protein LTR40_002259 [Exophiala xenobiotica]KAK5344986.1 hypothetical protein LTR61_011247 [Exophiala xenobiotica]